MEVLISILVTAVVANILLLIIFLFYLKKEFSNLAKSNKKQIVSYQKIEEQIGLLHHESILVKDRLNSIQSDRSIITTEVTEKETNTNLSFFASEVIQLYNFAPKVISRQSIKVNLVENNNRNRENISFERDNKGGYWIVETEDKSLLLFPKRNISVNKYEYPKVKLIFDCQAYEESKSRYFTLIKPANVSFLSHKEKWQLESKGELDFTEEEVSITRLETELERVKLEKQELAQTAEITKQQKASITGLETELEQVKLEKQKLIKENKKLTKTHRKRRKRIYSRQDI